MRQKNQIIHVIGNKVSLFTQEKTDYISITDIARYKDSSETKDVVKNWMRSKSTIEFLGLWEKIHNPAFKGVEFDSFLHKAGSNSFVLSPSKWVESTGAIGIITRSGNNGGTYAHKDIAFEFASWVSAEFKLYLIVEFQRLKEEESNRLQLEWDFQRMLAKVNYRIHTDAIKEKIIPQELTKQQVQMAYTSEADILNMALFGVTAKQWRDVHIAKEGNIRDYAAIEQLVVLSNLESINSVLIHQGVAQGQRLQQLNQIAITQMKSLLRNPGVARLQQRGLKE
ncbi:MAG: KilA-N domain-containing protein [Candidatus Omnitrophica bacterium]|nr:KilA-N domain-containing protein [Candidatus Omnitrophota bacterium]